MFRILSVLFLCVFFSFVAPAQVLDTSFQPKFLNYGILYDVVQTADNKVIAVGDFNYVNGVSANRIARLNSNGQLDATFNTGTGAEDGTIWTVAKYADGKVLVAGQFTKFNGVAKAGLVRLNADGSIDNTFTSSIAGTVNATGVGIQSDGKIIVVGATFANNTTTYFLTRLNADGTKDAGFGAPQQTFPSGQYLSKVHVYADNKFLIGGFFTNYSGLPNKNNLVRFNSDGAVDLDFHANITGDANNSVRLIQVLADGKIYAGRNAALTRYNANGSKDNAFAPTNPVTNFNYMAALSDGSVVITSTSFVTKLSNTGAVVKQVALPDFGNSVFLVGNDKLMVEIHGFNPHVGHVGMNADLTPNAAWTSNLFLSNGNEYNLVNGRHAIPQGDKFIIKSFSNFYSSGDPTQIHKLDVIFRVNNNFTYDNTFTYTNPVSDRNHKLLLVDSNNKIYVTQNVTPTQLRRLNADGTADNTFTPIAGFVNDVAQTTDGNFVAVIWDFANTTGILKKFNNAGTIDPLVDIKSVGQMNTIDVTSDGKWYVTIAPWVAAAGTSVNGTTVKSLFRMNSNGTLDNSFVFAPNNPFFLKTGTQGDKLITAGSIVSDPTNASPYAIERWATDSKPDLIHDDATKSKTGYDFAVRGDYIYYIGYTAPKFELVRLKLNGEIDSKYIPFNYRSAENNQISSANPERLYMMSDKSAVIFGNAVFKIDIPPAPTAPSVLAANVAPNAQVTLIWKDNSDTESGFEIERAEGTGAFSLVGKVNADVLKYVDITAADAKSYGYRVRAVNVGGESAYSNTASSGVIMGVGESNAVISVYPNPVKDHVNIQSAKAIEHFTLYQLDGRQLENAYPRSGDFKINMSGYSTGLYLLKLEFEGGKQVSKIFKQ